jgi:hypothetical protein
MGGLDGPPKPPALGSAPAEPWRSSSSPRVLGGLDGPPKPPALGKRPGVAVARLDFGQCMTRPPSTLSACPVM